MNLAHIHLLLNHLPTIGFGIGLCFYLAGYFGKDDSLKKASLVLLFLIAVMAIPTYVSGNAAESTLCPEKMCPPDVSLSTIRAHEDIALFAFVLMEATGFFAWLVLWQLRRKSHLAPWNWIVVLVLGLATFGLMALAANVGGEIRHPEIRVTPAGAPEYEGISRAIGAVIAGNTGIGWMWPAAEAVHFVGLTLLFVSVLVVNLRVLGMAKALSFSAVHQLLPLGMLGFLLNLVTGMMFFIAAPGQYTNNPEFHRKVVFIVLAGINVLYFMMVDETWAVGPDQDAPLRAKVVAVVALYLWIGILYYGNMLPFLGNSF
jgi:uncharacterized membrane protein